MPCAKWPAENSAAYLAPAASPAAASSEAASRPDLAPSRTDRGWATNEAGGASAWCEAAGAASASSSEAATAAGTAIARVPARAT